ncbi:hypothetical protein CRG98_036762 [Punica granatum]|nr:hypothetical protein CRG98_036762 [Punica granatum]
MAYIPSDMARKASFRKRKGGLMKKMEELNTLCDVHGFLIIHGPEDKEPTVWPSPAVAEELLERFMSVSDMERGRKMMDHEHYLRERITKSQELIAKHARRNRELQAIHFMNRIQWDGAQLSGFSSGDLNELVWLIDEKRREVAKRRNLSQYVAAASSCPPSPLDHLVPPSSPELEIYLPQVRFSGEDDEEDLPEFNAGLDNSDSEASRPPTSSSGMSTLQVPPSGSRVDTGTGLINSHDALMWEQFISGLMNDHPMTRNTAPNARNLMGAGILRAPTTAPNVSGSDPNVVLAAKNIGVPTSVAPNMAPDQVDIGIIEGREQSLGLHNGNNMGGGDGLHNMEVETREDARGIPDSRGNESDYAFVLQDDDTVGGESIQSHHQVGSGDQAGGGYGIVLPQPNFEHDIYPQNPLLMSHFDIMNRGTGDGGSRSASDVEPTKTPGFNTDWLFYS